MLLVMVKLDPPEVRSKPGCAGEAERGPTKAENTPKVRAATTSAMAPDATTDFVLLNRSGFIDSSSAFSLMGKPTEGPQVPLPAVPR